MCADYFLTPGYIIDLLCLRCFEFQFLLAWDDELIHRDLLRSPDLDATLALTIALQLCFNYAASYSQQHHCRGKSIRFTDSTAQY